MKHLVWGFVFVGGVSLVACGGHDHSTHDHSTHDHGAMEMTKGDEMLHVTASMKPSVDAVSLRAGHDDYQLLVVVKDKDDHFVSGATVTVALNMPAHGHGSNVLPKVTETEPGHYVAAPMVFTMPGSWQITVQAEHGEHVGSTVLTVNID